MQDISHAILLLQIVNILEPVTDEEIYLSSGEQLNRENIPDLLNSLIEDGFIAKEQNKYRVTLSGLSLSISKKTSYIRDISRMKYLLDTTRQRGGESVGR